MFEVMHFCDLFSAEDAMTRCQLEIYFTVKGQSEAESKNLRKGLSIHGMMIFKFCGIFKHHLLQTTHFQSLTWIIQKGTFLARAIETHIQRMKKKYIF